jgi:hypothetical protein
MQKTYTKAILGTLVLICGVLSPYSFFHHEDKWLDKNTSKLSTEIRMNITYAACDDSTKPSPTATCVGNQRKESWATNAVTVPKQTDLEIAGTLEAFLKVVYVILWPLLWIAGWAMDNSLIYGEIFGLDQALFKFWQIMKNFANFALWFLFLRSIVKYILNPSEKKNPKDMISKLLVAWVWVQLSRFIMGALVDLSSVLTIGIGWLPLNLIDQQDIGNKPIFWVVTKIKLNDAVDGAGSPILYRWKGSNLSTATSEKFLLPCLVIDSKIEWDAAKWKTAFGVQWANGISWTSYSWNDINTDYCIASNNIISKTVYVDTYKSPTFTDGDSIVKSVITGSLVEANKTLWCDASKLCETMKSFTTRAGGFQWAFYSLYTSILSLSTIHVWVPKSNASLVIETLIKTIVWLAYLIPLAILCIVLIMRVWYLRLIIAFSPFIILAEVKDLWIGGLKDGVKVVGKTAFNAKNVISLLALPIVVTFAVSLSIVFLASLSDWLTRDGSQEALGIYSRTEWNYKCYDIVLTDICLDIPKNNIGTGIFDYFSWIIMNLFGIGMMWFIVMAALKSSELTKGVAESVGKLSWSILQSAPIIPIPGTGKRTSLGSLKDLPGQVTSDLNYARSIESKALGDFVSGKEKKDAEAKKKADEQASKNAKVTSPTTLAASNASAAANILNTATPATAAASTFANEVATKAGVSNPNYTDFNDLVTKNPALFGQIMAHDPTVTPEKVKALYTWKDRDNIKTQIDDAKTKEKDALDKAKKADSTPPDKTTQKDSIKEVTIGAKKFSFTQDQSTLQVTDWNKSPELLAIPQPGKGNEYDKAYLQKYIDYLNELWEEKYDTLGWETWQQLINPSTHTYMIKSNDGKPAVAHIIKETSGLKVKLEIVPKTP